jgi:threonine synthase
MNPYYTHMHCTVCSATYAPNEHTYTCPACGEVGTLDIVYDFERLRAELKRETVEHAPRTMWRYGSLLPIPDQAFQPTLPVGWTPLIPAPALAKALGVREVWLKDDGRNPTASLKDRASAMVVARARQMGVDVVTTASTGNAAAALAGICANVGMRAVIFVPATAPEAKIAQLLVYGATVLLVEGTYDVAFDLCVRAAEEYGWYCRNTGMNPYTSEGKKTAAMEICEQLGWNAPDVCVVSVGDGSIIGGQHKGFRDLHAMGWIDKIPRMVGVQAEGSANLVHAWQNGTSAQDMIPGGSETIADSISAGLPRDRAKALRAVRDTGGAYVSVSDEEILAAIPELARQTGVFVEPACAAVLPGLKRAIASGVVNREDRVVLLLTGNGLKDVRSAVRSVSGAVGGSQSAHRVRADMDAVRMVFETLR